MRASRIACDLLAIAGALLISTPARPADPDFGAYWHDGRAELDGYRSSVQRYGQRRPGRTVLIYVTEPFSESKHVKVEDPARNRSDTFDVLKLNVVRDFQTGIYDYHTVVSLFTRSRDFAPVKLTFSSSEWCGQVYEELNFRGAVLTARLHSYFEDESSTRSLDVPRGGVVEDDLFILLRGLRGPYLRPGERRRVPFLPSSFHRRLTHRPIAWTSATVERSRRPETVRVPAGTFATDVYVVRPADGREGRFNVERSSPHRIVRWSWGLAPTSRGAPRRLDGMDTGELTGTARLQYWKLNALGDEKFLDRLGLGPAVK